MIYIYFLITQNKEIYDIVSWNNGGNSFIVKKLKEFQHQVLPFYFKHSNYASFVRQVTF